MKTTKTPSVIPDASALVEEWERAAAGRREPDEPVMPHSSDGLWMLALYVALVVWVVRSLCAC